MNMEKINLILNTMKSVQGVVISHDDSCASQEFHVLSSTEAAAAKAVNSYLKKKGATIADVAIKSEGFTFELSKLVPLEFNNAKDLKDVAKLFGIANTSSMARFDVIGAIQEFAKSAQNDDAMEKTNSAQKQVTINVMNSTVYDCYIVAEAGVSVCYAPWRREQKVLSTLYPQDNTKTIVHGSVSLLSLLTNIETLVNKGTMPNARFAIYCHKLMFNVISSRAFVNWVLQGRTNNGVELSINDVELWREIGRKIKTLNKVVTFRKIDKIEKGTGAYDALGALFDARKMSRMMQQ